MKKTSRKLQYLPAPRAITQAFITRLAVDFGVMTTVPKLAVCGGLCTAFLAYTAYVYTAGTRVSQPVAVTDAVSEGHRLFQQHNCIACHQFYGLGGYMGPDLTNIISAEGKGPLYARAFMQAGTARMPNFGLSERELDALIAFLEYVDATGTYPADNYRIRWYGIVEHAGDRS